MHPDAAMRWNFRFSYSLRSSASSVIGMLKSFCFDVFKMSMRLLCDMTRPSIFWWTSRKPFTLHKGVIFFVDCCTFELAQELHHCSESMLLIVGTLLASWESTEKNLMSWLDRNKKKNARCMMHMNPLTSQVTCCSSSSVCGLLAKGMSTMKLCSYRSMHIYMEQYSTQIIS
jgi:hypothetical protein